MNVQHIAANHADLPNISPIDGQIIALSDQAAWFYDLGGQRRRVSGVLAVNKLPQDTSAIYKETLVVVTGEENPGIYLWTGTQFLPISTVNSDEHAKSETTSTGKFYLVGSPVAQDNTSTLRKNGAVYVDASSGRVYANGFGGKADSAVSADSATNANRATNDSSGQNIASTYIKELTTSGSTVTIKYGNNTTTAITTADTHSRTNVVFTPDASAALTRLHRMVK